MIKLFSKYTRAITLIGLLGLTACNLTITAGASKEFENIKAGDRAFIKDGFYGGCRAIVTGKDSHNSFLYLSKVTCQGENMDADAWYEASEVMVPQ